MSGSSSSIIRGGVIRSPNLSGETGSIFNLTADTLQIGGSGSSMLTNNDYGAGTTNLPNIYGSGSFLAGDGRWKVGSNSSYIAYDPTFGAKGRVIIVGGTRTSATGAPQLDSRFSVPFGGLRGVGGGGNT